MKEQNFDTGELKAELERSLGFALRSLTRLDGASAVNFRAVRDSDGFAFAVKCSPPESQQRFERLVEHLEALKGSKAVRRIFEDKCPATFRGWNLLCTAWCFGERIFPDRLADDQLDACLDEYLGFSAAMQNVKTFEAVQPLRKWREAALRKRSGLAGLIVRRLLLEMKPEECDYRPELLRVIHGDFHHGNFLFVDGRVAVYLDLEEFRQGYPADDLLRYFTCAAEHLRWYESGRRRGTLRAFARAVRRLPYSRHEWVVAINGRFVSKMLMHTWDKRRIGLWQAVNLAWRFGFYRAMRRIVDDNLGTISGREKNRRNGNEEA